MPISRGRPSRNESNFKRYLGLPINLLIVFEERARVRRAFGGNCLQGKVYYLSDLQSCHAHVSWPAVSERIES